MKYIGNIISLSALLVIRDNRATTRLAKQKRGGLLEEKCERTWKTWKIDHVLGAVMIYDVLVFATKMEAIGDAAEKAYWQIWKHRIAPFDVRVQEPER